LKIVLYMNLFFLAVQQLRIHIFHPLKMEIFFLIMKIFVGKMC